MYICICVCIYAHIVYVLIYNMYVPTYTCTIHRTYIQTFNSSEILADEVMKSLSNLNISSSSLLAFSFWLLKSWTLCQ